MSKCCPKLKSIDLRDCPNIDNDKGLALLAQRCADLIPNQTLSLKKGGEYLLALAAAHPDLGTGGPIDLRNCSLVTISPPTRILTLTLTFILTLSPRLPPPP